MNEHIGLCRGDLKVTVENYRVNLISQITDRFSIVKGISSPFCDFF